MTHEEIKSAIGRLRELEEKKSYLARDVMRALIGRDFPDLYGNIGTLKALLRQADPDTHVEMPKDTNGEVIHVGDAVKIDGTIVNVCAVALLDDGWKIGFRNKDELLCYWPNINVVRYHKPTVEDVLREFGDEVRRCCDTEDTIAEYAAKLREVMADDAR